MAVIVRNDRGKVLGRISKVGAYIDLRGIKQRMSPVEAYKFATELASFAGSNIKVVHYEDVTVPAEWPGRAVTVPVSGEPVDPPSEPPTPEPSGPACEVCGKRFKDGRGMAGHSRTHAAAELGVA